MLCLPLPQTGCMTIDKLVLVHSSDFLANFTKGYQPQKR